MSDPLFSVLIPAYNASSHLAETIESALMQREVRLEVIVVDDGSTDDTLRIASGFGKQVSVVSQENSGVSAARNLGAKLAKGDFLAFLDADDLWLPDKLKLQQRKLGAGFAMVYSNRYNFGNIGDLPEVQSDLQEMPEGEIFEELLYRNTITNSSVVIDRGIFLGLGGFNAALLTCEDWDLWLRLSLEERIGYCPEPLVRYRLHAGGKSNNYKRQHLARKQIVSAILKTARGQQLPERQRRKALAHALSTSAWAAARSKDLAQALRWYGEALSICPFDGCIWYNICRAVAGRI